MLCGIEVVGQLQTFGYIHNMNVEWIQIVSYSAEECWGEIHIMGKTNQSPQQALWTKMTWSYTTVNGLDHSGRRRIQKNIALVNKLLPFKCLFYWLVLQLPLRHTIEILASIDIPHLISLGKYSIWRVLANLSTSK